MLCECGDPEESINHVYFECPPAIQVWAFSKIPSNPAIFQTSSLFTNMDHLFSRVIPKMDDHQFALILWYIWKDMNNKVFSNIDIDPKDTLNLAEVEIHSMGGGTNSAYKGGTKHRSAEFTINSKTMVFCGCILEKM